jgi:hypothetical protein
MNFITGISTPRTRASAMFCSAKRSLRRANSVVSPRARP